MLALGRWTHDHPWKTLGAWLAVLVVVAGLAGTFGTAFSSRLTLPDVESARGLDVIDARLDGRGGGDVGAVVFRSDRGVDDPEVVAAMTGYLDEIATLDGVLVVSPYTEEGARQVARTGPMAGRIAYAEVELSRELDQRERRDLAEQIVDLAPDVGGLQIEFGGDSFRDQEPPDSELLGLAFAVFILIFAFGSVLAMGLPIATAVAGIGVGTATVAVLSNLITMPEFTSTLGVMIGLGVGIDYALFIVTRYREGLHAGRDSTDACAIAIDTAGRAVLFAGTTVVISLAGLLLMGVSFVSGLALGAATTVAVTMAASVTLLPALLGLAGARIEVTRWRGLTAAGLVAVALIGVGTGLRVLVLALPLAAVVLLVGGLLPWLRAPLPTRRPRPFDQTLPYRWSHLVQRHPWAGAAAGTALLTVLALPVLGLRLGFSDAGNDPAGTTTRQAYELLSEGFGPGFNGPLLVVAELPAGTDPADLGPVAEALAADPGVAAVGPAATDDPSAPTVALWQLIPTTAPQDAATGELVDRLRDEVLPAATADLGIRPAVTGEVAISVDFSDYLGARLPIFFGAVLGLSFLLLLVVFRSVLVPLKAVLMNLLSIGAAYGLTVALFQWGWGAEVLGIGGGAPIEPFVPMMMFAIVFGLSMDYEVFLLSRIREEWDRAGDNSSAVADGLAATARVITAAAAIMVFVFASFLLEDDRIIKLFGFGLAAAIALDATVVRMLLVPATMELLGRRNWWLPGWLDRVLPRVDVEGHGVPADAEGEPTRNDEPELVEV